MASSNNNLHLKSLHISTTNISSVELLLRLFKNVCTLYTLSCGHVTCSRPQQTTLRTGIEPGTPSAQGPMRYRLRQPAPQRRHISNNDVTSQLHTSQFILHTSHFTVQTSNFTVYTHGQYRRHISNNDVTSQLETSDEA